MFDLEQAIAEWRRQMRTAGIQTPVPMEELESHLREDVEHFLRSGLNAHRAFEIATERIGPPRSLNHEFTKENTHMKRIILLLSGLLVIAFGMAFITPAVGHYRTNGMMTGENFAFLALGIVVTLVGITTTAWSIKRRPA